MKLLRIGAEGAETPCVMDKDGTARDVSSLVSDFTPDTIATLSDVLGGVGLGSLPAVDTNGARIGTPMTQPRNIYCIGDKVTLGIDGLGEQAQTVQRA